MPESRATAFLDLNLTGFERAVDSAKRTLGTLAAAFVGFKTGEYFTKGIKDALEFGNAMHNASREAGNFDPGKLLLVQKALEQAGRSSEEAKEEINGFLNTGRRLEDIFRGSQGYSQALAQVTAQYGKQAEILSTNAKRFSQVFDVLQAVSGKMREFFLSMTAQFLVPLQKLLETLVKIDLAKIGEEFGKKISEGINLLVGAVSNPELITSVLESAFTVAVKSLGNLLVAAFKTATDVLGLAFVSTFAGIGQLITGTLIKAFQEPLVYLQAGIERAFQMAFAGKDIAALGSAKLGLSLAQSRAEREAPGSKERAFFEEQVAFNQKKIEDIRAGLSDSVQSVEDIARSIRSSGGFKFGIGKGMTGQELVDEGAKNAAEGFERAVVALKGFKVEDIFGSEASKTGLADAVKKLQEAADKIGVNSTKVNDVRNTETEPFKVISDSLAKIGGGGGFIRASQTMLEKEAVKTNRALQEQIEIERAILIATQAKNINYMAGG